MLTCPIGAASSSDLTRALCPRIATNPRMTWRAVANCCQWVRRIFTIDTQSPMGKAMFTIVGAMAELARLVHPHAKRSGGRRPRSSSYARYCWHSLHHSVLFQRNCLISITQADRPVEQNFAAYRLAAPASSPLRPVTAANPSFSTDPALFPTRSTKLPSACPSPTRDCQ